MMMTMMIMFLLAVASELILLFWKFFEWSLVLKYRFFSCLVQLNLFSAQ